MIQRRPNRAVRAAWLAAGLMLASSAAVHAQGCDATWSGQKALFEDEFEVHGAVPIERRLPMPRDGDVMVMAIEQGADVLLSMKDGAAPQEADSPLARFGVQRLFLAPGPARAQVVRLVGKDAAATGRVRLRVVVLPAGPREAGCVAVHRLLSQADAAYARAQQGQASPEWFRRSFDAYRQALEKPESAAAPFAAQLRFSLAQLQYWRLQDWAAALSLAAGALRDYTMAGDAYAIARVKLLQAAALLQMRSSGEVNAAGIPGNFRRAGELLQEVIAFHAARGERYDQADATGQLGFLQYHSAQYGAARDSYLAAQALYRETGSDADVRVATGILALLDYELGNLSQANQSFAQVIGSIDATRDPAAYANTLNNAALSLVESGEIEPALQWYQSALDTARRAGLRGSESTSLQGMGRAYQSIGEFDVAETFFHRALALRTPELAARQRVETLRSLADVQRAAGRPEEALRFDQQAMQFAALPLARAAIRQRMALDYERMGQAGRALGQAEAILAERVTGDEYLRAHALLMRGRLRADPDARRMATADLRAALRIFRRYVSASGEFDARVALARRLGEWGDAHGAQREVDAALALAERMRMQSASPDLRAARLQSLRPAFDLKIDLLYAAHQAAHPGDRRTALALHALQVAESARARSLREYGEMRTQQGSAAPALWQRRRALYAQLDQYRQRLDKYIEEGYAADDKMLAAIRLSQVETRQQIDRVDAQLASSAGQVMVAPEFALPAAALPPDAGLVEYWLGEPRAYAWVVTRESLVMLDLGDTAVIEAAARAAHRSLGSYATVTEAQRARELARLGTLLWQPVQAQLRDKRRLVFVPDRTLHYIPFAALRAYTTSGARYLVQDHDVATTPSLGLLFAARRNPVAMNERMLAVADPVYGADDPRLPRGAAPQADTRAMARLPDTAREVEAITAIYPGGQVDRLQGLAATKANFLAAPLERYRYIHVASHAISDAQFPQLSALLLSSRDARARPLDGRVLAADLLDRNFNAELIVLSACDTALGKMVSGEGTIGLRYMLLARGARAVSASLWPVADRFTRELMSDFYASLFRRKDPPVAALGEAMRSAIARRGTDPAFWAAFDLTVRDIDMVR
jgi:CHAT domain-containing protein